MRTVTTNGWSSYPAVGETARIVGFAKYVSVWPSGANDTPASRENFSATCGPQQRSSEGKPALGPAAVCLFVCLRESPRLARPRFVCLIEGSLAAFCLFVCLFL